MIPSDEKSKGIMRQERHTKIKQSSIFDSELGEVRREPGGGGATNRGPMFMEMMLCEFSDLLRC